MQEIYLLDGAWVLGYLAAYVIFGGSMILAVILLSLAILIEAFILYRFKWGSILYSLVSSFTVNSVSATVGVLRLLFLPSIYISAILDRGFLVLLLFFVINLAITLLVETPILVLLNLDKLKLGLEASLKMNIASYLVYLGMFYLLLGAFSMRIY